MKKDQIYAVVDIESTGGSIGSDRMIQFACVLMENGEILESFDTFVNPLKSVPKRIQELTGIRPKDLKPAPYFEDIAPLLYSMLEESIFVAHNVGFDFQFLNEEFQRVGLPKLSIPAIDTVELAQVIFPTSSSYALQEIVDWLGYDLDRPHNALFDAEATAFLLNEMDQKLHSLPLTTVEKLTELSTYCIADTKLFFDHALESMKQTPRDLKDGLVIAEGLALKNPERTVNGNIYRDSRVYPNSAEAKQEFFDDSYLKRTTQEEMMDEVFRYFSTSERSEGFAIEASPGLGKSLGYLLPVSFAAKPENPILISTKTTVLQKQMVEETMHYLERFLPFSLTVASVKGRNHYLSLSNFEYKLNHVNLEDIEALFCMRILVWLTETLTGDLDEMGAGGNSGHDFWEEIRTGKTVPADQAAEKWREFDFFTRAEKRLDQASIIVTNHAFLVHDWKRTEPLFSKVRKLIIDEAHFFPDAIQDAATESISSKTALIPLKKLGTVEKEHSIIETLYKLADRSVIKEYQVQAIESNKHLFESVWDEFLEEWINEIGILPDHKPNIVKWKDHSVPLAVLPIHLKKSVKELTRYLYELAYVGHHVVEACLKDSSQLSSSELFNLVLFSDLLEDITDQAISIKSVFDQNDPTGHSWISYFSKNPIGTFRFNRSNRKTKQKLLETLKAYTHVLFTSSTLSFNHSIEFFRKQIELEQLEFVELESSYDYKNQAKVFLPDLNISVQSTPNEAYLEYLADSIEAITKDVSDNVLILFRSMDSLQTVFRKLQNKSSMDQKLILAQNISGTKSKLIKQFKKNSNALLLGADTFWEGVDLPGDSLKVVIVTRLPFDSPDIPSVKMRHKEIELENQNPFIQDTLPRAVLRMKQGFGRLIRTVEDKGVMVILDSRFAQSSYAPVFRQSIPSEVTIEPIPLEQAGSRINEFLKDVTDEASKF